MDTDISPLTRRPFPLPHDVPQPDPLQSSFRACTAFAVAAVRGNVPAAQVARELWPQARDLDVIQRAASTPAMTSTIGWAALFATTTIGVFLRSLAPQSAAAKLFDACLQAPLGRSGQVSLPRNATAFPEPVFVLEGDPMKVSAGNFTAATLGRRKKWRSSAA